MPVTPKLIEAKDGANECRHTLCVSPAPAEAEDICALMEALGNEDKNTAEKAAEDIAKLFTKVLLGLVKNAKPATALALGAGIAGKENSQQVNDVGQKCCGQGPLPVLDCDDESILTWFRSVELEYMHLLQVFWCVGVVDQKALLTCGRSMGFKKLANTLQQLRRANKLENLPVAYSSIRVDCLGVLESMFNQAPFVGAAWSADENARFRDPYPRGRQPGHRWTARARKAWLLVDRFLQLRNKKPRFDW